MPVLQYKCLDCSSIFDHYIDKSIFSYLSCLVCESQRVYRLQKTYFYPNKVFCPHDKALNNEVLRDDLNYIMQDNSQSCAGCGVDGASGYCSSGGCGSGGGCGSCGGKCRSV